MTAKDTGGGTTPLDRESDYLGTYLTEEDGLRLRVTVFAMDPWPMLAFAMHDDDPTHDAYRIVRSLDGRSTFERLPAGLRRPGGSSNDWTELDTGDLSVEVQAFQIHVQALQEETLLEWLREAASDRVVDAEDFLDRLHERAGRQALLILSAKRRCAALEAEDPAVRAIAVQMADKWTGTAEQLVQAAAGIAEPVAETCACPLQTDDAQQTTAQEGSS